MSAAVDVHVVSRCRLHLRGSGLHRAPSLGKDPANLFTGASQLLAAIGLGLCTEILSGARGSF